MGANKGHNCCLDIHGGRTVDVLNNDRHHLTRSQATQGLIFHVGQISKATVVTEVN